MYCILSSGIEDLEEEDDPDAKDDPNYQINTQVGLEGVFAVMNSLNHPYRDIYADVINCSVWE